MTTIKVNTLAQTVTQPFEVDVQVNPDDLVRAFDASLHQVVERIVGEHVADGLKHLVTEPEYVRSVRNWVMESLDYSYMSELVGREFNTSELVDEILSRFVETDGEHNPFLDSTFQHRLCRNDMFKSLMQRLVQEYLHASTSVNNLIDTAVARHTANLANEVADRVLTIIGQRLGGGADV